MGAINHKAYSPTWCMRLIPVDACACDLNRKISVQVSLLKFLSSSFYIISYNIEQNILKDDVKISVVYRMM